jgi:hypothetical protein
MLPQSPLLLPSKEAICFLRANSLGGLSLRLTRQMYNLS